MVEENEFLGKSERGMDKAIKISSKPVSDFKPARVSVELSPIEVQCLNILYNVVNPEIAPDMKALAKYMLARGMDSAFMDVRNIMQMNNILKNLPPELRDLFGGFNKGGPQI